MEYEQTKQARSVCIICSMYRKNESLITSMVDVGVTASLVEALERNYCPTLRYETLGSINNIAFGAREHTEAVINCGAIPKIINILAYEVNLTELAERTILILGSFALHGAEARRGMLEHGAVTAMLPYLRTDTPVRRLRTCVRALSNLCSRNDEDDEMNLELVLSAKSYIYDILDIENDKSLDVDDKEIPFIACDILVDACTALTNIMHGPDECIEAVQAVPGLTARLVALLGHEASAVRGAALSAVGNMLAGTDAQTDRCLDANFLHHIMELLQNSNTSLVKEAVRATCNIFSGTHTQIQRALEKGVLAALELILAYTDFECQMEAARAVSKLCVNGTAAQCGLAVSGALPPYCALLAAPALARAAGPLLQGLRALLQAAERDGNVKLLCYLLDELDVLEHMQQLKEHVTDETHSYQIKNISETIRKHARVERSIVHDEMVFTAKAIVQGLQSPLQETQARAARAVFYMLQEQHPPINALLEAGLLAPLVASLDKNDHSELHLNIAAWALFYITSGTRRHQMAVINSGAIPKLLALLVEENVAAEISACSLGNISQEPETRGAVLACVQSEAALSGLRSYLRSYGDLCSSTRASWSENSNPAVLALPFVSAILEIGDQEILKGACKAFQNLIIDPTYQNCFINEPGIEAVQAVPGLTARLVALLVHEHEASAVREAALDVVGAMLCGTDTQAKRCRDAGATEHLASNLRCSRCCLVGRASGAATNILFHKQTDVILKTLKSMLIEVNNCCPMIATRAITNTCISNSAVEHALVMSRDVLEPYCALLASPNPLVARTVLTGLYHLLASLQGADKTKIFCQRLNKIGVIGKLLKLQEQELDEIHRSFAIKLITMIRWRARGEHLTIEEGKILTLADIVQGLKSRDLATQTQAARAALRIYIDEEPPRAAMLQAGVVEPLVAALDRRDCSELQYAAADVILYIVEGTHKHRVAFVNAGVIPKLIAILSDASEAVELAARILFLICCRAPAARDLLLSHGVLRALQPYLRRDTPPGLLKLCVDIYVNLCTAITTNSIFELVTPALPSIIELLDVKDGNVLRSACAAIGNLVHDWDVHEDAIQASAKLEARLVALLEHEEIKTKKAALSTISSVFYGPQAHIKIERWVEAGVLDYFVPILRSREPSLVETAVAAVNNMLSHDCCAEWALENNINNLLVTLLVDAEPNSILQLQLVGALKNFAECTREHGMAVVKSGAIVILVAILSNPALAVLTKKVAAWTLQVIGEIGPEMRDVVLAHGAMQAMLPHMRADAPLNLLRRCVKAYATFCKDISKSAFEVLSPALPLLFNHLYFKDEDVLANTCLALARLMHDNEITEVVPAVCAVPGLTARLVALLGHEAIAVRVEALNTAMYMLNGTRAQVSRCLDAGCLKYLVSFLQCSEPYFVENAIHCTVNMLRYSHLYEQQILGKGILVILLKILDDSELNSSLQCRTVEALYNVIFSGALQLTTTLVNIGIIPKLVAILPYGHEIAKPIIYILGYISEEGPEARDLVLSHGAVRAMLPHIRADAPPDLLWGCMKTYRMYCEVPGNNAPITSATFELVSPALPYISEILGVENEDTLMDACWALRCLMHKSHERVEVVQAVPWLTVRLVALLGHEKTSVKRKVLCAVGKMLDGTSAQVDHCLNAGYVGHMVPLLQDRDHEIVETVVYYIHKVFCKERKIYQALERKILAPLFDIFANAEVNSSLQRAAILALVKITKTGTREHTMAIIDNGAISVLVAILSHGDNKAAALAAAGLGFLSNRHPEARKLGLVHGAVRAMLPHMRADAPPDMLKNCMWAYKSFCRLTDNGLIGMLELITPALPHLLKLLDIGDERTIEHACGAILGLTRVSKGCEAVQAVPGLTARLVALLGHEAGEVKSVVINVVVMMLSGTDTQLDRCLEAGCVEHLLSYLECREPALLQRAAEAATKILGAGHPLLYRALNKQVLTPLMGILGTHFVIQKRVVRAIINLCRRAPDSQRARLVSRGVLQPCCALLAASLRRTV